MKKRMKTVALLLAAAMMTTACGQAGKASSEESKSQTASESKQESQASSQSTEEVKEELEPVTLRIFMGDKATPDDALVAEYINELPQVQALNVTIEIVKQASGSSEHYEKIPLLLASSEQMDIGFDSGTNFTTRVYQNAYLDISEYLEGDELYDALPENLWNGVTINGGIYGVPTYKELGAQWICYAQRDIIEEAGIDPENITTLTLAEMEPILEVLQEKEYAPFMVLGKQYNNIMQLGLSGTYDSFISGFIAAVDRTEGKTVVNGYETEEFVETVKLMRSWNEKGYIAEDALTRSDFNSYWINGEGKYGLGIVSYAPLNQVNFAASPFNLDVVPLPVSVPIVSNDAAQGSIFGIYQKCENPERAYEFLKLWNTDPEVKNAFCYGIPGRHYELVDGQVQTVENINDLYIGQNWTTGNCTISYTKTNEPVDKWEVYEAWNETGIAAANLGFILNTESVSDKIATCNAVLAEYMPPLMLGFVEPESGIAQLQEQLKAAGIDDIVAEVQTQYDAWLASK